MGEGDAQIAATIAAKLEELLLGYLREAHAMEVQARKVAEKASEVAGDPRLEEIYRAHAVETRGHERQARERLLAHGAEPSSGEGLTGKLGALGVGFLAGAAPDTLPRLAAAAYAFESFEIATWETIKRIASRAGDSDTAAVAERIVADERRARERIADNLDLSVDRALEAIGAVDGEARRGA